MLKKMMYSSQPMLWTPPGVPSSDGWNSRPVNREFGQVLAICGPQCRLVESKVEGQYVDARLAEKAQLPGQGVLGYEAANVVFIETTGSDHPCQLEACIGRANVRVESAAGAGDGVDGRL